jgi:negative regulator of flagellin synthesis FlgM
MKIGHPANKPHAAPAAGTPAPAADVAKTTPEHKHATAAAAPDPSSTVALSSTATTLLSGGSSADFDAGKVAQVSSAISGGTFKINPVTIADKLISNAQELLGKVQS